MRKFYSQLFQILDSKQKRQARFSVFLILIGGIIDVIGLSIVLPVLAVANDPDLINSNSFIFGVKTALGLSDSGFLQLFFLSLVLVFVVRAWVYVAIKVSLSRFSYGISANKSVELLVNFFNSELLENKGKQTSDIVRDIVINTQHFSSFVIMPFLLVVSEFVIITILLTALLFYDPLLVGLVFLVVFPTASVFYFLSKRKVTNIGNSRNIVHSKVTDIVLRGVAGLVEMKLFREENSLLSYLEKEQRKLVDLNVKKAVLVDLFPKLMEVTAVLGIVAVFFYATFIDTSNNLLILLGVFGAASYRIIPSINKIVANLLFLREYSFLFDIISKADGQKRVNHSVAAKDTISFNKAIQFHEVEFYFDKSSDFKTVLPELEIKKGSVFGVVGESGSGKTTLINLLLGFYYPKSGKVAIDGKELSIDNRRSWWDQIGFVRQDVFIINESLKKNVCFGIKDSDIDMEKLRSSCEQAQLNSLIERFPNGLDESLGENGNKLSGGQKQRVAIARSLYKNSEILVFDEATSGLDSKTEAEIFATLMQLNDQGLTIVLITHNPANIKYCDHVLELADGKIKVIDTKENG
ncbi:MAG: hypothetical protein CL840_05865 [Crocinitomicaceae bacterium]|nr:hypothetical protein [Crocinitomicaceae bacterium]